MTKILGPSGLIALLLFVGCAPSTVKEHATGTNTTAGVDVDPYANAPTEEPEAESAAAPVPEEPTPSAAPPKPVEEPAAEPKKEEPPAPKPEPKKEPAAKPKEPTAKKAAAKKEPVVKVAAVPNKKSTTAASPIDRSSNPQIKLGDWPQWGGTSYRNNTPVGKNIPIAWDTGGFDRKTGAWHRDDAVNIKWVATLGSQSYGNAVVADGKIYCGTNNGSGYLKRYPARVDLGCLLAFNEADGSIRWQHSSEKLSTGRVHDWPLQGICCAPLVVGDRLWFVSSRGHVVCLDTEGYYDGEDDGAVQNELARQFNVSKNDDPEKDAYAPTLEALNKGTVSDFIRSECERVGFPLPEKVSVEKGENGRSWQFAAKIGAAERQFKLRIEGPRLAVYLVTTPDDKLESDTVWSFDMMKELGTSQHNMCSCSITHWGDVLFVNTSNGVDESHLSIPSPNAPSFIAMSKDSGEVLWTDKSPGLNILHGQWSSPTVGLIQGQPQVIFAGGDGWVYSFRADAGKNGSPELLWKFDANPKESKWVLGGRGTRNNIIATPVIHDGLVYVAVGQDPEHGEGVGHLWCINPTKKGDVSLQLAVHVNDRTKVIAPRRLQDVDPKKGEVAIDNPNSAVVWHYSEFDQNGDGEIDFEEQMHRSCGTVAIKNDLLFIADFSGLFHCLDAKSGKVHWTYDMLGQAWGSPLIVENHVYIGDEDGDISVFELKAEPHEPISEISMGNSVYSTPIVANNVLYIGNRTHLFAIENSKK